MERQRLSNDSVVQRRARESAQRATAPPTGTAGWTASPTIEVPTVRPFLVVVRQGRGAPNVARLGYRSEEHTSELQSLTNLVCRLLLEKKKKMQNGFCPGLNGAPSVSIVVRHPSSCAS